MARRRRGYPAAWLAVPGGTIGDTGIAGGGIGYLMGVHGLTCDNRDAAQLVTADGTTRTVDVATTQGMRPSAARLHQRRRSSAPRRRRAEFAR